MIIYILLFVGFVCLKYWVGHKVPLLMLLHEEVLLEAFEVFREVVYAINVSTSTKNEVTSLSFYDVIDTVVLCMLHTNREHVTDYNFSQQTISSNN